MNVYLILLYDLTCYRKQISTCAIGMSRILIIIYTNVHGIIYNRRVVEKKKIIKLKCLKNRLLSFRRKRFQVSTKNDDHIDI